MCTLATDKFGADSGSSDMGLTDFVIGKADRNGNSFKVHADEGIADINSGIGLDFFQGDRMLKGLVGGGCKGTAGFGLGNDIDKFRIRNGRLFNDDGTVQMFTALGGKINAACLCRFINSGKTALATSRFELLPILSPHTSEEEQPTTRICPSWSFAFHIIRR